MRLTCTEIAAEISATLLLYAVNADSVHHAPVLAWWEQALGDGESLGLPWIVLLGFLRIATNPDIFPRPLSPDAATGTLAVWLSLDNTRLVQEKEEHWRVLRTLLTEAGTAGNLVTDAPLAALAISHGAELVSCDTDFARFRGLRWHNPLACSAPLLHSRQSLARRLPE